MITVITLPALLHLDVIHLQEVLAVIQSSTPDRLISVCRRCLRENKPSIGDLTPGIFEGICQDFLYREMVHLDWH